MDRVAPVALVLLVLSAGCLVGTRGPIGPDASDDGTLLSACPEEIDADEQLPGADPDPERDVLGWENGVWFDDPIDVDQSDGLSCAEYARALARTMARVEELRRLEFQSTPEARVIARETFRNRTRSGSTSDRVRTMQNVVYEALFLVDEETDAVDVRNQNQGTSVAAYYSPSADRIVIITPTPERIQLSSTLLAHELVHALQDQHFERPPARDPTIDGSKGRLGLTEGDANYVQYRYDQRCGDAWAGTCLVRDPRPPGSGSSGGGIANVGMQLISYQPYSDGPAFVEHLRDEGGWEAVNEAYGQLPASTEQTIHPSAYPSDRPVSVDLTDTSTQEWTPLTRDDDIAYETVGEVGLFVTFLYPTYDSDGAVEIVSRSDFLNRDASGAIDRFDPYDYRHEYSAGWGGDRLLPYRNGDEYAYVWKLAFDTRGDAGEFLEGYRRVLEYRGAERVDGQTGVWRIGDDRPFADAFSVTRRGDTVLIVNAPTVDALSEVRPDR